MIRKTSIEISEWLKDRKPVSRNGMIIEREALKYCDEAFSKSYRWLIRSGRYLEYGDIGVVNRVIEGNCGNDGDCREIYVLILLHLC
jgi:hypothetical protein